MTFDSLDPTLILLLAGGAAVLALALAAYLALRDRRGTGEAEALAQAQAALMAEKLATAQAELAGRLSQLAESQAAAQARLAQQLQAQERQLSKSVEDRLGDMTRRIGETLDKSSTQSTQSLTELKERLAVIDAAQKNITELSTQVVGLQDILSNKQARGAFGEVQLENLVQAILPPNAYSFQAQIGEGRRVDCLLILPNPPGPIGIDAKFPLESYRTLQSAPDDAARALARKALGAAVLKHVRDIKERYIVPGETADSALMFLPSEAVYAELHANLGDIVELSYREKVWIVSPTTLMATLNTVRAVLKDARMREQAGVIQREVMLLATDVDRLDERVGKLQTHFNQASEDVRQIRISTDKVTKRAGRIEELQLGPAEEQALVPPPERLAGE
ncbi:DNA recombination protein RmuC [Oceanibaculum pacificum]|uniref:DNA recombination protein RmuC homolog n=1 Tax=Oceanibaculum pacificum TaxID=580166 RepID=A0A154VY62_9PROT|nr:DNA recombination protein RmuC [Oceanibaculum pacificum]KZD06274.1 recombinase RmuC [Oceanibaculum pacificum]